MIVKLFPFLVKQRQQSSEYLWISEAIPNSLSNGSNTVEHCNEWPILVVIHYLVQNLEEAHELWLAFLWDYFHKGRVSITSTFLDALLRVCHFLDKLLMIV